MGHSNYFRVNFFDAWFNEGNEKAKESLSWVKDSNKGLVMFIGIAEILGGIGLILPSALGIAPVLTPITAVGIAIIMALSYQEKKSGNIRSHRSLLRIFYR